MPAGAERIDVLLLIGTFMLGSIFGAVTTVAVFRSTLSVAQNDIKHLWGRLRRLEGEFSRMADHLGTPFLRRKTDP